MTTVLLRCLGLLLVFCLVAPPFQARADVVNVYSSRERQLIEPLLRVYEELTGVRLNLVVVRTGLVQRVKAEGEDSPADLILTNRFSELLDAKAAGITQPVLLQALRERMPVSLRDPSGHWFGLTKFVRALMVSKSAVPAGRLPLTYEEIGDPEWRGQVCVRSGSHPFNTFLVASRIAHMGEAWTERWLRGLKRNLALPPARAGDAQIANVAQGRCNVALASSYYIGQMLAEGASAKQYAEAVRVVVPNLDGQGAHMSITGMAMTKFAPNRGNALQLMDFLTSEPAQFIYAQDNHEYPIREDVPPSRLVASWGKLKYDTLPLAEIASLTRKAQALVRKVEFDSASQRVGP